MSPSYPQEPRTITVNPQPIIRAVGAAILIFAVVVMAASSTYIVQPGFRGVEITLGNVAPEFRPEGIGFKQPFITHIQPMSIRQQTRADAGRVLLVRPPAGPDGAERPLPRAGAFGGAGFPGVRRRSVREPDCAARPGSPQGGDRHAKARR